MLRESLGGILIYELVEDVDLAAREKIVDAIIIMWLKCNKR